MRATTTVLFALVAGCGGVEEKGDDIPAVETIEPSVGPQAGGISVTLSGSGFDFGQETPTRVAVGTGVVEATVVDDATITFTTPPGPEGRADVVVFHGGGATVAPGGFTYEPLPEIAAIEPRLAGEGSTISVRGAGFQSGAVAVAIDGAPLSDVQVQSDRLLTATLPAPPNRPFVPVDVEVTTANGTATLPGGFRYTRTGLLGLDYSVRRQAQGKWFFIDPVTAEMTFFDHSTAPINMATVAANGEVFALVDGNVGLGQIGRIGPDGLTFTNQITLSTTPIGGDLVVDGDIFVLDRRNNLLRRYSQTGAEVSAVIPQILARGSQPTCILRNNAATLLVIQRLDGPLSALSKVDGTIATVATLNGSGELGCHAATRIGNDVFVVGVNTAQGDRNISTLFRLDTGTGGLTEIGALQENGKDFRIKAVVPTPPGF